MAYNLKDHTDIVQYCELEIIPKYSEFDGGHKECHVRSVIKKCNDISLWLHYEQKIETNLSMVYVIAVYHDIGLYGGRKDHGIRSAEYLRNDKNLRRWFNEEEINIMAEAVEDHRASNKHEPRSIYGKIVSDGDRKIDLTDYISRCISYTIMMNPDWGKEEIYPEVRNHLVEKYGRGGYLRLYLNYPEDSNQLEGIYERLSCELTFRSDFEKVWSTVAA